MNFIGVIDKHLKSFDISTMSEDDLLPFLKTVTGINFDYLEGKSLKEKSEEINKVLINIEAGKLNDDRSKKLNEILND